MGKAFPRWVRLAAATGLACAFAMTGTAVWDPANASVISGGCTLQTTFRSTGASYNASTLSPSEVVKVPQSDSVSWQGSLAAGSPDGTHTSSGDVVVELPIGSVTIKSWHEPFGPSSDSGVVKYNFPSVIDNVDIPVKGHEDDNGKTICSGSATVKVVAGTFKNPASYGSIAGMVVFGAGLVGSGLRRKAR